MRRWYRPLYSPRSAVISPASGLPIGLHLVEGSDDAFPIPRGHARSARCAVLARFNSQFMLEVFEAHALATRVLFVGAMHRLDFLR